MAEDKLAEQEAAMQNPAKKFVPGMRAFGYIALIASSFIVAAGALGITSYFLQQYGNLYNVERYPDAYTMRTINLGLFNSIWTLIIALAAVFLPMLFLAFLVFSACAMWGVVGGIFTVHVPFSGSCNATTAKWQQFVGNCKYFISLEALAWTLFGLTFLWFAILVADTFMSKRKRHYCLGE